METPLLFQLAPHLLSEPGLAWVSLIPAPTPVQEIRIGHPRLFVKREDATDRLAYGGNKVRNLEFLLGTAIARGARRLATVAPYGSNFVAALAAQSAKLGIPTDIYHFVPALSPQMHDHAHFSAARGARLRLYPGGRYLGLGLAYAEQLRSDLARRRQFLLPAGGSNAVGALGHVNAVLELSRQIRAHELPEPDVLVVGVGTCGTMAGLLAGIRLAGLKTRLIGVRCVDPIVCNRFHVAYLANAVLKLLRSRSRVAVHEVDLRNGGRVRYGSPLPEASELIEEARAMHGLELDTTYTTKVFALLKEVERNGETRGQDTLYWHTFSPGASRLQSPRPHQYSTTCTAESASAVRRLS